MNADEDRRILARRRGIHIKRLKRGGNDKYQLL
jgi:hypothetical protein